MNELDEKIRVLRASLRKLRAQLREARMNPPPKIDLMGDLRQAMLEGFSQAHRDTVKGNPHRLTFARSFRQNTNG